MRDYIIGVSVRMGPCFIDCKQYDLGAEDLQEGVDMAYCRRIFSGEEVLDRMLEMGEEPVVERSCIDIIPYHEWYVKGEKGGNLYDDCGEFAHPCRLSDSEIKEVIIRDSLVNGFDVDREKLERMVFLI